MDTIKTTELRAGKVAGHEFICVSANGVQGWTPVSSMDLSEMTIGDAYKLVGQEFESFGAHKNSLPLSARERV